MRNLTPPCCCRSFRGEMPSRGDRADRECELVGGRLGVSDQPGNVLHRQFLVDKDCNRPFGDECHRREIALHIIWNDLRYHGRGCKRRRVEEQRVAIRLAFGDLIRADCSVRPGCIVDQECLTGLFAQFLREQTSHRISWPSRRVRKHQAHELRWILVCKNDAVESVSSVPLPNAAQIRLRCMSFLLILGLMRSW